MEFKPGSRWKSVVCNTEVVVVRPPKLAVSLECGGHPMTAAGSEVQPALALSADHSTGTHVGKRYYDEESGIELLGSKAGTGSLSVNGRPLKLKQAKPLPASD
jgi:hypothetical protein